MKEVLAIIRMEMISKTKEALLKEGFAALNCRKVMGRGKKKVDFSVIENMVNGTEISSPAVAEAMSEGHRLVPKRLLSLVVADQDVKKVVDIIIETNSKGRPGDGKIFVMPISDVIRIRTGETGEVAI
ncbi:P-II family nitrogen regulator [Acetivibrio clariflavus]|uniref:Nitrogen regulatory protein PII n=1 Tax=Acetivibrio clariflavus (strain DSM 19732 / NBRC 101661 / EBR45) TaxID=720554 RepID=G8LZL9_ACECE|nr:P-II family nitrogen regulator [Acetivibrio clariflavus]AEV67920.1 nitrogen regulatory protein PII [Acetivibrio clariflavus DSM 19732]HOQ00578.1 P-II family nitrogen regulator [Acetivibrio clariflavus]HPU41329.1 P-II family nitrogen regulator [Acetivibrio clariflavus]